MMKNVDGSLTMQEALFSQLQTCDLERLLLPSSIVVENANLTGYCKSLNENIKSGGMSGILRIRTCSPSPGPVEVVASMIKRVKPSLSIWTHCTVCILSIT
ncbi:hypothetical protein AVEN_183036-1 [Araneus ventricosus]|uniref:Uncharacterized protein n=1 Tax=Araneus ventricosus TaxID=182803 RepID=A0A4Y2F0D9_ARAVE|nr:hypothetical protein AVEN_183036-1 [Araneus ventricosus]